MTTTIQKWGNSLGVRIPKEIARQVSLGEGSVISFSVEKNALVLSLPKKKQYTLKSLLKGFDKKTQHPLADWGSDVGREAIPPWRG